MNSTSSDKNNREYNNKNDETKDLNSRQDYQNSNRVKEENQEGEEEHDSSSTVPAEE